MNNAKSKDRLTMEAIGVIYCKGNHPDRQKDADGMCSECRKSIETTLARSEACPYGHEGNCEDCNTHCQNGEARSRIKTIMRYAAPRMAFRHPLMTLEYLRKKFKK